MAGSIFYLAPVDNASGKIFGKKERFVAVRRLLGKRQRGCCVTGERTTPVTEAETQWRSMFAQISAATHVRMADSEQMKVDQLAFREQTKYKTLYQYVWNEVRKELESGE